MDPTLPRVPCAPCGTLHSLCRFLMILLCESTDSDCRFPLEKGDGSEKKKDAWLYLVPLSGFVGGMTPCFSRILQSLDSRLNVSKCSHRRPLLTCALSHLTLMRLMVIIRDLMRPSGWSDFGHKKSKSQRSARANC